MWPKDQLAEHRGTGTTGAVGGVRLAAITMPAAERYVAFARLATAHLCGVLGLTVSRVADLRLAVDEACGQFLLGPGSSVGSAGALELRFEREPEALRITVRGPIAGTWPDREGLGWLVLDALVADLGCEIEHGNRFGTLGFSEPLSPDEVSGDVWWFAAP
ncbi:hypothetical protein [Actinospica sp.]|jgi:anti-sigma regulatory factor (Ser/Thr protein kinase)|uniref:ATP-binding protein n=1 Tax=Actinospica sp. TaxID=1872142 RepID=UPI002CE888FD|nr:hypothetical protein [Actinospica sp.]HWG25122.1 hypothetical protein [Actinospica sp.]